MRRITTLVAVLAVLALAQPARAAETMSKLGTQTVSRTCRKLAGNYAGEGCRFTNKRDAELRVKTINARGIAEYRFLLPQGARLLSVKVWTYADTFYSCYGVGKSVTKVRRHVTVKVGSGRHGHVSVCDVAQVQIRYE
jgi:hypothetical protein